MLPPSDHERKDQNIEVTSRSIGLNNFCSLGVWVSASLNLFSSACSAAAVERKDGDGVNTFTNKHGTDLNSLDGAMLFHLLVLPSPVYVYS